LACLFRQLGYEVVEVNASDTRNKSDSKLKEGIAGKMANRIRELVTNTAIGIGEGHTNTRRQILLMDEVDGMSGVLSATFV
jgi:replication factor C subunit 1